MNKYAIFTIGEQTTSARIPTMQEASENPQEWNKQWEKLIASRKVTPAHVFKQDLESWKIENHGLSSQADMYSGHLTSALYLRLMIAKEALGHFIYTNIAGKWMAATVATRRKHVLVGLSESCSVAINLNNCRIFVGDILTVEHLSTDGHVFLDMLKSLIPPHNEVPTTLQEFSGKSWSDFLEKNCATDKAGQIALSEWKVLRTKLIYYVLEYTMLSFLGLPRPPIRVHRRPDSGRSECEKTVLKMMKMAMGKQRAKESKAADMERLSKQVVMCFNCGRSQSSGEKFQRCSRCWNAQKRSVTYCSKECQVNDYKAIHKSICGQILDMETATETAVSSVSSQLANNITSQIPPPVGGFKPSAALLDHIQLLNQRAREIAIYVQDANDPSKGRLCLIDLPFVQMQLIFKDVRDKAMSTGDRGSILAVCHYTLWFLMVSKSKLNYRVIIDQMEKEWELDDFRKGIMEMQEQQFSDPHRRPPAMLKMSPQEWVVYSSGFDFSQRLESVL
ncbi:hypothetical protein BDP27DRAFT_1331613 [Rhodocollybia butyracea]|uniref:MYND-type domain-containing protein n=1 Tax=Rhodocollybia butyracea TaxID=206335 RepID=A0A9P5PLV5_9AGAR|nr:hypothetical protein BDP27DRAFT_1331613 [Rhodocollybia butyracea]